MLDLLVGVAVRIVAALVIGAVRRGAARLAGTAPRLGMPVLLLAGGLAVGLLAQAADLLGGDSQAVLFSGQSAIPTLDTEQSASIVLVVVAAKAAAYGVSLGCGFRGGPVFPAIFTGIGLAMFAVIALDVSPTLAAAVGAGAGMAAGTRLMFSALVFAALLVGRPGLDAVPATVLAIVAAWLTATAIERRGAQQPAPATRRVRRPRRSRRDEESGTFPGADAAWTIIGILAFGIFLLMLVSLARGEFLPHRAKSVLLGALALALMTFACLSFGQTTTGNNEGTASLYSYFASTAVIMLLVLRPPPHGPPDWLRGHSG